MRTPLLPVALLFAVLSAVTALAAPRAADPSAAATAAPADGVRRTPFTHFGARPVLELRGDAGAATLDFGLRADELVTRAVLRFRYAYSPALAPSQSHIRLTLNDQVVGLLPVSADGAGRPAEHAVDVDPRLLAGDNRLVMALVAQRAAGPGDAARPGLWADISGASELETGVRPLTLADDLARLPEPFFDRRDHRRVTVPFAFAASPSLPALRSAAVVASWLGQLAAWRGARFPVRFGEAPSGHAVVFAANGERPPFLAALAPADGPQLRLMTNPADGHSKLLLVLGRDGNDLETAAVALVLGQGALSGAVAGIRDVRTGAPRQPYDAPRWVRVDRAMKFAELTDWPQQLEAAGRAPQAGPVRVSLRVPPDLVAWRSAGVPMTVKYRVTPPACAGEGRLLVNINDELLQDVSLAGPGAASPQPAAIAGAAGIVVPAYRLRSRSELQFLFRFEMRGDGACRDAPPAPVRAAVDADSTIDFSGFPHYAEMPHLGHFAAVGFPFTRHADLSQTVAVLPERPSPPDVEALLALMGRMGESTGLPATGVRVAGARDEAALADADLLVIGAASRQALLERWSERLPVALVGGTRRVSQPLRRSAGISDWVGLGRAEAGVAVTVRLEGEGPLAALLGFESPLTPGRSVVALTAAAPDQLASVLDAMDDRELRRAMLGSAVLVHPEKVESLRVGAAYAIGFLPPWAGLWYRLSDYPVTLAVTAAIVLLVLAWAAWRMKRARQARRACGPS